MVGRRFIFVTEKGEQRGPYVLQRIDGSGPAAFAQLRNETTGGLAVVTEKWLTEPASNRPHWLPEVPF